MVPLVSRKLVTAVAVIGGVLPVTIAWGATDFSYGGTPRYLLGMAQTSGAAYRNYNRISGNGNETKYVCYGPAGNGACYAGASWAATRPRQHGLERVVRLRHGGSQMRRLRDALGRLSLHSAMRKMSTHSHRLTRAPGRRSRRRRASPWAAPSRPPSSASASRASGAEVQASAPGSAAAQLGVLQERTDREEPAGGRRRRTGRRLGGCGRRRACSAPTSAGRGSSLYAAARSNGGACNALSNAKGGVGTQCVDDLPAERHLARGLGRVGLEALRLRGRRRRRRRRRARRQGAAGDDAPRTPTRGSRRRGPERRQGADRALRRRNDRQGAQRPTSSRLVRPAGAGASAPAPAVTRTGR